MECNTTTQAFDDFFCSITMLINPPADETNHNITLTIGTNPNTVISCIFSTNLTTVSAAIKIPGNFTIYALNHQYGFNVSVTINITKGNLINILKDF